MTNRFASSVLHDGFIYGFDEHILACVDAATGALKWRGGRYGYGQPILASGQVIVLSEDGELALVRAAPAAHEELARIPAIEGKNLESPGDGSRHSADSQRAGNGGVRSAAEVTARPA